MEYSKISDTAVNASRIGLGTWAIGGWMWGGTDEEQSIATISDAIDRGITFIDTAPVYGFGRAEELVGKAVADRARGEFSIATKVGIEWPDESPYRNGSRDRIMKEVEDSLERLGTDYIDLYQVHWPDPLVRMEETAGAMEELYRQGLIKAVGVSNFSPEQMEQFMQHAPLHSCQPPYNLFERQMEEEILPFCIKHDISLVTYGALCRGLLTGKMRKGMEFTGDDLRNVDPKFQEPRYSQYLEAVEKLKTLAERSHDATLLQFAVRWILDKGVDVALWGARRPDQLVPAEGVFGWNINDEEMRTVDTILEESIKDPVGPEFMGPPSRSR
jgi:aryl-alcohol dehydrogenase-like predicted oxidoreductase